MVILSGAQPQITKKGAEFQNDGNLVVYDSYNKAIWSTNTSNKGAKKLKIQDDGNLVICNNNNSSVWSSETQR